MKKISFSAIISICIIISAFQISAFAYGSNYSYTFTTTDDEIYYSNVDPNTDGKILIYGRPVCEKTNRTLHNIAESDWIETANIDIACINVDGADKETVLNHKELINCDLITFCYGQSSYSKYSKYVTSSGSKNGYYLPIIVYIDKNDNVITATSDTKTSDEIYYTMFGKYPEKKAKSLENCTVTGVKKHMSIPVSQ